MRDYAENIAVVIRETTDLDASVFAKEMPNGKQSYGVTVRKPGEVISPTVYVDQFYNNHLGIEDAAKEVLRIYEDNIPAEQPDFSFFTDYSKAKERLKVRLMPATFKTEVFCSAKDEGFDDLIFVPYVMVNNVIPGMGSASIMVKTEHIERWGVDRADVLETAISNTKAMKADVMFLGDFASDCLGLNISAKSGPIIVTNEEKCFGAAMIIAEMANLKEKYPDGFFVLPSSVHEVIVMPKDAVGDKAYLDSMVKEINETSVLSEEVLANHVYEF